MGHVRAQCKGCVTPVNFPQCCFRFHWRRKVYNVVRATIPCKLISFNRDSPPKEAFLSRFATEHQFLGENDAV
jgi:hypothetical protein